MLHQNHKQYYPGYYPVIRDLFGCITTISLWFSDFRHNFPLPHILSTRRGSAQQGLRCVESQGNGFDQVLMGAGAAHHHFDTACVSSDDRTDFE